MVKRLWLIRIDQGLYIAPRKLSSGVKSQNPGGQFWSPKREIRRSPNVSFNKSIVARAVCDMLRAVLLRTLAHRVVQFGDES
ncbi:hypothetical protein TNCV_4434771 [Trichonephila clavipes]|nr:hypothetical protein TNCV_4434771 [Trichonephila clavipes]